MRETLWTECVVLIPIFLGFFGAAWKIDEHKDNMRKKYKIEINEIDSIIYSSEIIPYILQIMEEANKDSANDPDETYEDILSAEKYSTIIRQITKAHNKLSNVKYSYRELQDKLSSLQKNLIWEGIIFGLISAYHIFEIGNWIFEYNQLIFIIFIFIFILLLNEIATNFKIYNNNKKNLSQKYDSIVIRIIPVSEEG